MDQDKMILSMDQGTPTALTQAIIMKPQDKLETETGVVESQTLISDRKNFE